VPAENRARPRDLALRLEQGAAVFAVVSLGIWVGGLVALGACAAPIVFHVVPAPLSGDAMEPSFAGSISSPSPAASWSSRAKRCAIYVASATPSGAKVPAADRARTALAVVAAAAAIYGGTQLSPQIVALHAAGAGSRFRRRRRRARTAPRARRNRCEDRSQRRPILLALQVTTLRRVEERARGPIRENEAA